MIKEINKLDKAMQKAAKNLEFELAANIRDQIKYLKARVYGASIEDRI
jgi:excinuclease ABC subunit B